MTTITTYATLKTALADALGRDINDTSDILIKNLDLMIQLCERKFTTRLRVSELHRRATAALNEETELLPTNLAALESVAYKTTGGVWKPLENVTVSRLRSTFSEAGSPPDVYSIVGHEILFGPFTSPAVSEVGAPTIELIYWQKPTALTDAVQTNEIIAGYPELYLYGSLVQSSGWVAHEMLPVWRGALEEGILEANEQTEETSLQQMSLSPSQASV